MTSTYPGTIDSYTTRVNGQVIDASHVGNLQDAVVAIETTLGTNPLVTAVAVNVSKAGPWGAALTSVAQGTAYDVTRATNNDTAFNAIVAYANTRSLGIWFPAGVWDLNALRNDPPIPIIGVGSDLSFIRFPAHARNTGVYSLDVAGAVFTTRGSATHGLSAGNTIKFTVSTYSNVVAGTTYFVIATGLTTTAFEISATSGGAAITPSGGSSPSYVIWHPGAAWIWGDDTTTYQGTHVGFSGITLLAAESSGTQPQAPFSSGTVPVSSVGLVLNGMTGVRLADVSFRGFGIGLDAVNNCGGLVLDNCWSKYSVCHVAVQMREGDMSGSDWQVRACWFTCTYAGISMSNNSTDLWVEGGQLSPNFSNRLNLTNSADIAGVWIGRNAADGAIGSDGFLGVVQTGVTTGMIRLQNIDFEGARYGWAAVRMWGTATIVIDECNMIPYPLGAPYTTGTSGGGGAGVIKVTNAGAANIELRQNNMKGPWVDSTAFLSISGANSDFTLMEYDTSGKQIACVQNLSGGAALSNDWVSLNQGLTEMSGLATQLGTTGGAYRNQTKGTFIMFDAGAKLLHRPAGPMGYLVTPSSADFVGPFLTGISTLSLAGNELRAMPFDVQGMFSINLLEAEITTLTAGGLLRLAVFADDGTSRKPGTLLVDYGTISQSATGNVATATGTTLVLNNSRYWFAARQEGTAGAAMRAGTSPLIVPSGAFTVASNVTTAVVTGSTGTLTNWPSGGTAGANAALGVGIKGKVP